MPRLQTARLTTNEKGRLRAIRIRRFAAHESGQPQDHTRLACCLESLRQAGRTLLCGSGLSLLATGGSLCAFSTTGIKVI